jgi:hypothetical protein
MPSARVVEVSQDDPDDEVVERVAFRLVDRRAGKPIVRLLLLVLLALIVGGAGALYWLWPFE